MSNVKITLNPPNLSNPSNTTNKSNRDLNKDFNLGQFNTNFDNYDVKIAIEEQPIQPQNDDVANTQLPHSKSFETIIIMIRETFYKVLSLIMSKQNPIAFILSSSERYFACALFLIIFGGLLLLVSNLLV